MATILGIGANGNNTIGGFEDGTDLIDLSVYGVTSTADFTIADAGANAVISGYGGGTITVNNIGAGDLTDADFIFS